MPIIWVVQNHQQPATKSQSRQSPDLLRTYKKALIWRKAMLGIFAFTFVAIVFWSIPWLPYGLSVDDYDTRFTLLLSLVLIAGLTAYGAVYHRDLGHRLEQTLLTWSTVHEGLSDLRRREYFYDRILIECEHAQISGGQFTIIALRIADTSRAPVEGTLEKAIRVLLPLVGDSDCLTALGPREIGILAPTVGGREAPLYAETLNGLLSNPDDGASSWAAPGWAVYGIDSTEAGALVGIARERVGKPGLIGADALDTLVDDLKAVDYDSATA